MMTTITSSAGPTIEPTLVLGLEEEFEARNVVHKILDRPDPDVTLRPASTRSGTLHLFFLTEAAAADAVEVHRQPAVFDVAFPERPTFDCRYVVDGSVRRSLDEDTRNRFIVEVAFREVAS